jgi:hypothetical protein
MLGSKYHLLLIPEEVIQRIQKVHLLRLRHGFEVERLVLAGILFIHKLWRRDNVDGRQRHPEVHQRDTGLGGVHHRSVRHALVFPICKNLYTICI